MGDFKTDRDWAIRMQPHADRIYESFWPDCKIINMENAPAGTLAAKLDVAGADKAIQYPDGSIAFLAQRLRRYRTRKKDVFTLRYKRDSGSKTEYDKLLSALSKNTLVSGYYGYGLMNREENGVERFRILNFTKFLTACVAPGNLEGRVEDNRDGTHYIKWYFHELSAYILFEQLPPQPQPSLFSMLDRLKQYAPMPPVRNWQDKYDD